MSVDTDIIIIGAGMSGVGMAIQLVRKFGTRSFEIIEKTSDIGGTWFVNSYPGCGCDVPSHFYSYSFAPNPNWSRKFSLQPEIHQYFISVANQYQICPHVRFHSTVKSAEYDPETATWKVIIEDQRKFRIQKCCKILISAVGALSIPKQCDIPGAESFKGHLFHSAKWDHSFDYRNKEIICIGNGCSATQFVPVMSKSVKKITQFSRQAHWLSERPNPEYSRGFQFLLRWVPGVQRAYRAYLYALQEKDFAGFDLETGKKLRNDWTSLTASYIAQKAPEKYRDFLVPKTVIGCKRRVMDTDYLTCLHRDNVELVYDDPIEHITPEGVTTKSGRAVHADAIVLANGFETQLPLFPMEIRGQNGQDIANHWMEFGNGSPEAYFGTCFSGFPNFFVLMGPNTLSGHLSVMYTTECQIGFILRVIQPILEGIHRPLSSDCPESVVVTVPAERKDVEMVDRKAKKLVWASGCTSWFIDPKSGRNTVMWPDWQFKFWLRGVFVPWTDFVYRTAGQKHWRRPGWIAQVLKSRTTIMLIVLGGCVGWQYLGKLDLPWKMKDLQKFLRV